MQQETQTLATFYAGWDRYQDLLVEALGPLSAEQLSLRAAPHLRPVWYLGAHIIGARIWWFQTWMGEGQGDAKLGEYETWDQDDAPQRTAAELVEGLEASWQLIAGCLGRWTPDMLADDFTRSRPAGEVTHTRQWIIWHVLEHDIHHGGELFFTLGMNHLATPDL